MKREPTNDEANRNYFAIEGLQKEYKAVRAAYSDKDHHGTVQLITKVDLVAIAAVIVEEIVVVIVVVKVEVKGIVEEVEVALVVIVVVLILW